MIRHIVIAIDGPAAAGKTTVGKAVARKLKTAFLDSGRLYRVAAVSSLMLNSNLPELLDQIDLKLTKNKFIVNGVDVTDKLDTVEVGERASVMSVDPRLREWVNKTIRKIALDESVVVTGRDIGTVVLPDAEVKVYLDASHEARVERRFKDERGRFSREEISGALLKRDKRDSERDIAPLKPADDSHIIDSTNLRIGQVVQKITNIAKSELAKTKLTKWWRFSYFVASNLSRWLFDIEINGKGNIPSVGPVVAVANHASLLDVFFVGLALPRMGSYIAKKELFRIPVISACVRGFGAIPVDRDNIGRGLVLAINKALKADKLLTIYPEGTRSKTGKLSGDYKVGAVRFAHQNKATLVPVGIIGAINVLPPGTKWPRKSKIIVNVGSPIDWDKNARLDNAQLEALTEKAMESVAGLSEQPFVSKQ